MAKNYCNKKELDALNMLVSAYLEFAEMQAKRHIPMYMKDWIETLDGFLKLSKYNILSNAGQISAAMAEKKAKDEYHRFKTLQDEQLTKSDKDFIAALEITEKTLLTHKTNNES